MSTDWEDCYRTGDTPWDKGAPAPPLVDWLAVPGRQLTGDVLVPGCGLGHDVRAIVRASPGARVCGLDLSGSAVVAARRLPAAGSETYRQADLFMPPEEWRHRFDWVVEHTCFCAIDPARRVDYVRAVAGLLRPGGHLLAIFYLQPWAGGEPRPPGGGPPFGSNREELDALFAADFTRLAEHVPARTYPGREGRELLRLLQKR